MNIFCKLTTICCCSLVATHIAAQNPNKQIILDSLIEAYNQIEDKNTPNAFQNLSQIVFTLPTRSPEMQQWVDIANGFDKANLDSLSLFYWYGINGRRKISLGDVEESIKLYKEAYALGQNLDDKDHLSTINYQMASGYAWLGDYENAISRSKEIVEYLETKPKNKVNNKKLAFQYSQLAMKYFNSGDIPSSFPYHDKALALTEGQNTKDALGFRANKGISLAQSGNLKEALKIFLETSKAAEALGDPKFIGLQYMNVREVVQRMGDYDTFFEYGDKAIALFKESGDDYNLMMTLKSNAEKYREKENYVESLKINLTALSMADSLKSYKQKCNILNSIGLSFIDQEKYSDALKYLTQSVDIAKKYNITYGLTKAEVRLGKVYFGLGDYEKALPLLEKSYAQLAGKNDVLALKNMEESLYKCYYELGNYKEAFDYLNSFRILNDSLLNETNIREMTQLEAKVEMQQQEALLTAKANRNRSIAFGVGAFGLLALGFLFNSRRQNKIIGTANEQLQALNRTKDQLFSIIGHDLKKPVLAFRGITEKLHYLIESGDNERLLEYGKSVEKDALELNNLTDNLLSWALLQKDLVTFKEEKIDLALLADEVVDLFSNVAKEKNIKLSSSISNTSVTSDINAIMTVMRNLVDNALKYTDAGGEVTLTSNRINGKIELSVNDTGQGIQADKIPNLFVLSREKSTEGTSGEKGTGLGLHLVKDLVEKCKGTISVASEVGKGTSFKVVLPG